MAQQTIGVGAAANDGTGDTLRASMIKVNENFDETYLTNVVNINSASDFPVAISGVIELVPNSGDTITYVIAADDIDIGSDRFTITDGDVVIQGMHKTASELTSTNTGTLFTCVDSNFFLEFLNIDCPSAKVVDFSTPVAPLKSLSFDNVIIRECDTIADIAGAFTTSLRTSTVVTTNTGGFLWTGSDNNQINISQMFANGWAGTLLDLGTATFDIIDIGGDNRFVSPVGTTILSGEAASANFSASGRGIVNNNLFNGDGTSLVGIDTEDLKWDFEDNIFANNINKNTESVVDSYLSGAVTVGIGTQSVYVPVAGALWLSDISNRFTVTTAGLITYIGLETLDVTISANSTVEKSGGGADTLCSKIAIDSTVSDKTRGCTQNSTPTGISSLGLFELVTGTTIELYVGNESSTSDIIVDNSVMVITRR